MSRIAYVNGQYVAHHKASVHIEDRGYQFADGVYEVCAVRRGQIIDLEPHMARLERSLRELRISWPMRPAPLVFVLKETVRRNRVRDGMVYLQITRGVARRDHPFPAHSQSALVVTARALAPTKSDAFAEKGVEVISLPDIRWERCDIKSVSLLPNVLAKQAARERGAFEAWLIDAEGKVTEGASTNAWIVDRDGVLITRNVEQAILNGVTRRAILDLAREHQIRVAERSFTLEEAKQAQEAFLTSTTSLVMPVVKVDGSPVGQGIPGPVATRLRQLYLSYMAAAPAP